MQVGYKILQGDNRQTLKSLPANSIDCCITSPPYYALRDYGTGHWVGGDPNCLHCRTSKFTDKSITGHKKMSENKQAVGDGIYKSVCKICGAVRVDEQIGLEQTPDIYICELLKVFKEVKRVLKPNGTLWVNIGDSYWGSGSRGYDFTGKLSKASEIQAGNHGTDNLSNVPECVGNFGDYKNKDLIGIPWLLAFALRKDGWYLRQDIIWAKQNCMPESVKDRCTKSHEYVFLFSKSPNYYFDSDAIRTPCSETTEKRSQYGWDCDVPSAGENGIHTDKMGSRFAPSKGANKRDVWFISNSGGYKDEKGVHYATYPTELVEPMVLAGCPRGGTVLDPFNGSGTTGEVAMLNDRNYIGCELSKSYVELSERRLRQIKEVSVSLF